MAPERVDPMSAGRPSTLAWDSNECQLRGQQTLTAHPARGTIPVRDAREDRRQAMVRTITARLARVRGNLTDAEFAELLGKVLRTAERFAEIDRQYGVDPLAPTDSRDLPKIKWLSGLRHR